MKLYTYTIHYTTSLVTEMKDCETPIDWEKVKPGSIVPAMKAEVGLEEIMEN